jgi:SAM-dependent methyltransferase
MPNKFKQRSTQREWLDAPGIPTKLLEQNLRELDFLNRLLGGHAISVVGLQRLMTDNSRLYHLVDLGCGSGDVLKYTARWARKNGYLLKYTGVDQNPDAIAYLKRHCRKYAEIDGVVSDYKQFLNRKQPIDIIHCSLFCHHVPDPELVELLRRMNTLARVGFVINDLQRNPLAYYGAKFITWVLNGSSLSKNDGPISVLRGFRRKELERLLQKAGVENYAVHRKWGFRYLVIAGRELATGEGTKYCE